MMWPHERQYDIISACFAHKEVLLLQMELNLLNFQLCCLWQVLVVSLAYKLRPEKGENYSQCLDNRDDTCDMRNTSEYSENENLLFILNSWRS